jgi:predicted deacylase
MKETRSYNKILNEIINLNTSYRIEIIGYVNYSNKIYPMLSLKYISKMAKKTVIITSGQHGDEPYAVTTLLKFIKQPMMFSDINYFIYPICNPFGYSHSCRDNGNRQDTNNDVNFCQDSKVPELALLYDAYPSTADIIIDLHGDSSKEGFCYAYEHKPENLPSIVEPALIENDIIIPYAKTKTIYRIQVHNGVLTPPHYDQGIELFMEKLGVTYTITIELPGKFDGQKRAEGGVKIINSILRNFKTVSDKEKTNGNLEKSI